MTMTPNSITSQLYPMMTTGTTSFIHQPTSIINRLSKEVYKHQQRRKDDKIIKTKESRGNVKMFTMKMIFYLCLSSLIYNLYLLTIKLILNHQNAYIPSIGIIIFFWSFYQVIISMILMKINHIDIASSEVFNKSEIDELIIRSLIEFLKNLFTILSLSNMRLISAITIYFLSPIIRTYVVLKQKMESIKKTDKITYVLSFIICLIFSIQDPTEAKEMDYFADSMKGIVYSVIVTIIFAFSAITEKKTCNEYHPYVISFVGGLLGVAMSPIIIAITTNEFKVSFGWNVLFGVFGGCGFFAFYYTLKLNQMMLLMHKYMTNYAMIAMGYVISIMVLDERITVYDIIASIISIYINYQTKLRLDNYEVEDD